MDKGRTTEMFKNEFINEEGACMLPDTQNQNDKREIPIDKVGIKSLKYPIVVKDKDNGIQHTIATISMTVDLPKEFKGTHMSRFVEVLMNKREIHIDSIYEILKEMQNKLHSQSAHIELEFPYFKEKLAPVSRKPSLMDYRIRYHAVVNKDKKDLLNHEVSRSIISEPRHSCGGVETI